MSAPRKSSEGKAFLKQLALGRGGLLLIIVILVVGFSACSNPGQPGTSSEPVPQQQGAAGADNPQAEEAEAKLMFELRAAGVPINAHSTIQAYATCVVLGTGTSANDAADQLMRSTDLDPRQATEFVTAAQDTVCSHT